MSKNYYDILGVEKNATAEQIKKAYKKAAIKWHPDKWASKSKDEQEKAELKFKEVNEAYNCLSDADKKQHYDMFGNMDGFGQGSPFGENPFDWFFHNHRNSGPSSPVKTPGESIYINLRVTITELFNGIDRDITIKAKKRCNHCHGTGGDGIDTCPNCHGSGMVTNTKQTPFGFMQTTHECDYCHGTGKIIKNKCSHCYGSGLEEYDKTIHINISTDSMHHLMYMQKYNFAGYGSESKHEDMPNGNLYITIIPNHHDENHDIKIDNMTKDIRHNVYIDYIDCLLGTKIKITHPNGKQYEVEIPECTQHGSKINIDCDVLIPHQSAYYCVVHWKIPEKLNSDQRKLLEKLKKV